MPDDRLQTPARRCSFEEEHQSGANWRTFILIASDTPTPNTKNSKTLRGPVIQFEVLTPAARRGG
jgi:hypothetical protein